MANPTEVLSIGQSYSNEEIYQALGVGNAGGVRIKIDSQGGVRRAALFTSTSTVRQISENPYKDRIEGDVLVYTGAGRSGDQAIRQFLASTLGFISSQSEDSPCTDLPKLAAGGPQQSA
jgi:hypothetical protein